MKEPLKISDHFQSPSGFLLSISFLRIVLNARFSVAVKVPRTELYAVFEKYPFLVRPNSFQESPQFRCWFYLSFCQEILELIPVLCFPVE